MQIKSQQFADSSAIEKAIKEINSMGYKPIEGQKIGYNPDDEGYETNIWIEVEMDFLNFTPHDIVVGEKTYKPVGLIRKAEYKLLKEKLLGVEVHQVSQGEKIGDYVIPNKLTGDVEGAIYSRGLIIVSAMVAPLLKEEIIKRGESTRVFSPLDLLRDKEGRVIGCKSLREW